MATCACRICKKSFIVFRLVFHVCIQAGFDFCQVQWNGISGSRLFCLDFIGLAGVVVGGRASFQVMSLGLRV